jgi:hypothetical protein
MQNKTFAIGILSLTAVVLAVANLFLTPEPAHAIFAVRDRDYTLVTARTTSGADALWVLDSRSGQIAVLTYDPQTRTVKPRKVRAVMDAFGATSR